MPQRSKNCFDHRLTFRNTAPVPGGDSSRPSSPSTILGKAGPATARAPRRTAFHTGQTGRCSGPCQCSGGFPEDGSRRAPGHTRHASGAALVPRGVHLHPPGRPVGPVPRTVSRQVLQSGRSSSARTPAANSAPFPGPPHPAVRTRCGRRRCEGRSGPRRDPVESMGLTDVLLLQQGVLKKLCCRSSH